MPQGVYMKKLTLLLLSLVLCVSLFALTACDNGTQSSDSSSVEFDQGGAEIDDDMIGFENSDEASKNTNGGIWTDGN